MGRIYPKIAGGVLGTLLLAGCGGDTNGNTGATAPSPTPIATTTGPPISTEPACKPAMADPVTLSPYGDANFTTALDNSARLQFPSSGTACLDRVDLRNGIIDPENFYHDDAGRMTFSFANGVADSDSAVTTRMELRGTRFDAAEADKVWDATIVFPALATRSPSFTFGQVFSETEGAPILRLARIANRDGKTDHLWAVYRRALGDGNTIYTDLGAAPPDGTAFEIRVTYNTAGGIQVDSATAPAPIQLSENFAFWSETGKHTYFKAGCYLQEDGDCNVRFLKLSFDR